jgi:hypothetical protein
MEYFCLIAVIILLTYFAIDLWVRNSRLDRVLEYMRIEMGEHLKICNMAPMEKDVRISELENALEMTLGALANQKFINEGPTCGDAWAEGPVAFMQKKQEIQEAIDRIYREGWGLLQPDMNLKPIVNPDFM